MEWQNIFHIAEPNIVGTIKGEKKKLGQQGLSDDDTHCLGKMDHMGIKESQIFQQVWQQEEPWRNNPLILAPWPYILVLELN